MKVKASYEMMKWTKKSSKKISNGMKMTCADAKYLVHGDFQGKASIQYLMFYTHHDGNHQQKDDANYVGIMKMNGKIGDKSGTFALEDEGEFHAGLVISRLRIIEGSGTGKLKGIKGVGTFVSNEDGAKFELNYFFKG